MEACKRLYGDSAANVIKGTGFEYRNVHLYYDKPPVRHTQPLGHCGVRSSGNAIVEDSH